jgi:hypothetical protein
LEIKMNKPAENAIRSDASEQSENKNSGADENNGAEIQMSPRMLAMESIAAQRRDSLAADGVDVVGMDNAPGSAADIAAVAAAASQNNEVQDDQLAAQLGQDERTTHFADDSMRVKVKVEGVEMELPLSEVVKSYQKDATASRRLQEATQLLKIAEQQAINVAQTQGQENNQAKSQEAADAAPSKEERLSKIKGAFSKLYEGDEEGAAQEMLALLGPDASKAIQQQTIDPAQIATQVRQQLAVESAYGQVQSDYPEIFANDERGVVLGKAAYERMTAKETSGVPRVQALREATEEVATLFGIKKDGRQQAAPEHTARDTKLAQKRNLDIPNSANVVAGNKETPAEAPNVSSVIAEMAKGRLGQSMNPS